MNLKNSFHPYAFAAILMWSLGYVFTRLALQYFSAFSLGFLRYFVASCALVVVAGLTKMKLPNRKDLPWFFVSGGVGFFIYMIAFNQGQGMVSSATGSIVIATAPVMTAFLARIVYREKLKAFQWAAIAIEFLGVAVLTLMDGVFSINIGILWLLLAAFNFSIYNLLQRKLTKTYTSLQTSTYSIFSGTLMLAIFAPISVREISQAPAAQFLYVAILGVGCGAIAYVAWSKAVSKAKQTSQVSNYMFISPLLTSVLGFIIAGEVPDLGTLVGGGIILIGVLLFNFGGNLYAKIHPKGN